MDSQTKREIWLLAIGTALIEVPVVAIAALVILSTERGDRHAKSFQPLETAGK